MSEKSPSVDELFGNLSLGKSPPTDKVGTPNKRLENALKKIGFRIFQSVYDLGYYGWNPSKDMVGVTLSDLNDESEVKKLIDVDAKPDTAVAISTIHQMVPTRFLNNLTPQTHANKFPYGQYFVASLHVATQHRHLNLESVDFCFGGSTLEMLANQNVDTSDEDSIFLTLLVPGTNIIMIYRHKDYIQNYSDPGFQFERLCTGKTFYDRHDEQFVEHLQLMKLVGHQQTRQNSNDGTYTVLFDAEIDARDANGDPVEIKASNPRYWGTRVMFQMLSGGSLKLYAGRKSRGSLIDVNSKSLESVAKTALGDSYLSISQLESNILTSMKALKENMELLRSGGVFQILFRGSGGDWSKRQLQLKLYSKSKSEVFPSDAIVSKLIKVL